ncbi:hypothetical protein ABT095_06355 [Kitasatospora sp. NPDC002227]|uniref:hypothetical protein n=1 Tax=Kitasatospora sp. NPDC002227 TaxID=3154773 RepID=UPI00332EDAE0
MTQTEDIQLVHELDAAWILALWIFIHGGDPAPGSISVDRAAVLAAAGLSEHLAAKIKPSQRVVNLEQLQAKLKPLGIQVERGEARHEKPADEPQTIPRRPYCFTWKGEQYCIVIPRTHLPLTPG